MNKEIVIIGGGVIGATVGVVLLLAGAPVRIMCRHWIEEVADTPERLASEPRFASQYPAASVIPHSVTIKDADWHITTNQRLFHRLIDCPASGVRAQRHYEVFESPTPIPEHARMLLGFSELPLNGSGDAGAPRRAPNLPIFGWSSDVFFAEMQRYRSFLGRLYRALGGTLEVGRYATMDDVTATGCDTVVNCGGAWAPGFVGDPLSSIFVKGVLVAIDAGGAIPHSLHTSQICSYNYSPSATIYGSENGDPIDVYFYPRTDRLLLGGTRFESVELDGDSRTTSDRPFRWRGEAWTKETVDVPRLGAPTQMESVPEPIISLNRDLILNLTGFDIGQLPRHAMVGYRHKRSTVRLEESNHGDLRVIHNYGHGGAGVTLSWSSALRVASLALGRSISSEEVETLLSKAAQGPATI
ncbi:MAG: hypothetical protein RIS36_1231 [Pseudomonadota bacterium]|jgi:glycine/D-amino acid oxidase-like deaminating enzyme